MLTRNLGSYSTAEHHGWEEPNAVQAIAQKRAEQLVRNRQREQYLKNPGARMLQSPI